MTRAAEQGHSGADPFHRLGKTIGGRFKVSRYIKGGGFAEVYEGFNAGLPDQRVVIKFLRDKELQDRFEREAQLLCRLDHPNICRIIDYVPEERALIVPFIDGSDCEGILRKSGPLAADVFLKLARTLTDALAFAHARKIAHRDIKPGNILIDRNGHPYLIDFGIAKEVSGDSTATRTGYIALTPQYAAPERQTGERGYDPFLSDIFELGVTLFVLATGQMPYRNPAFPNLRDWDHDFGRPLSPALLRILKKAAHPLPAQRYQTVGELAEAFKSLKEVDQKPRMNKTLAMVAGGVIVVAVGLGYIFLSPRETTDTRSVGSTVAPETVRVVEAPKDTVPSRSVPTESTSVGLLGMADTVPAKPETPVTSDTPASRPARVRIVVSPLEKTVCLIDGSPRDLYQEITLEPGSHRIRLINPGFPVLERTVEFSPRDTVLTYDLVERYAGRDSVDLRFALSPPSADYTLVLTLNGLESWMDEVPMKGLKRLAGRWRMEARLVPKGSDVAGARVDSCVTFPYGGGPRVVVTGARGEIDFGTKAWEGERLIPLQWHWSAVRRP
ncbi:MAG: serine/threonine-protein kinase [Candidatus Zixiibacteriota bacterium]